MIFETTTILLPHVEAGKLRPLAVATETRSPLLPGVPTTAESGYPKIVASFWSGLLAPAGTPAGIVGKLNATVNEILKSKEAQAALARLGAEAKIGAPQDLTAFIAADPAGRVRATAQTIGTGGQSRGIVYSGGDACTGVKLMDGQSGGGAAFKPTRSR